MDENKIHVRVRLIIIHNNKLLVQYRKKKDFYHYIGGHLEYGETIKKACIREVKEECSGANFTFGKILYIRDFIKKAEDEGHSVELFILGKLDNYEGLEKHLDPQHEDSSVWLTWIDLNNLPVNLLPKDLTPILLKDQKEDFSRQGIYVEGIE